jgi:hypothetical protein
MVFFILVVAAVIGIAVYVTKKTQTSFTEIPTEVETPFSVTPIVEETPPAEVTEASIPTTPPSVPTMTAKSKKKPIAKKKSTKEKINA